MKQQTSWQVQPVCRGLEPEGQWSDQADLRINPGMVAFLISATILGVRIGPAVALYEASTLVILFNSLRRVAYPADR